MYIYDVSIRYDYIKLFVNLRGNTIYKLYFKKSNYYFFALLLMTWNQKSKNVDDVMENLSFYENASPFVLVKTYRQNIERT